MRTIPRNTDDAALGDYPAECDYCGGVFLRSRMEVDPGGFVRCEQHVGEDPTALEQQNLALRPQYSLKLDKDQGAGPYYNSGSFEGTGDLIEDLWEAQFGQPWTDPLA